MAVDIEEILNELTAAGVISGEHTQYKRLQGGVSSDLYLIEESGHRVVVKQALERLKVKDLWRADVQRNRVEQAFIRQVSEILPQNMPRLVYTNEEQNYFVMEYLDGCQSWKSLLLSGQVNPQLAVGAGHIIGSLHKRSWRNEALANSFNTMENFYALRIEPYLLTTASKHPVLAESIYAEANRLEQSRQCLIHGDYSPKNIMVGKGKMVLLDCEVACFGEPTFDLAFLLNHFLLKALLHRSDPEPFIELALTAWGSYRSCFDSLSQKVEHDTGRLLLMLMLARVDGKSPVEYIEHDIQRNTIRRFVYELMTEKVFALDEISTRWRQRLEN